MKPRLLSIPVAPQSKNNEYAAEESSTFDFAGEEYCKSHQFCSGK
eukprot:CAMPEP_0117756238 /NCGR_PEP_ID=MMETSP0947-20121206/13949_1 /TAXON_ID=44440 /ORGANISM="Chattonella subsalsa, Strain CCMP2191" /LENGTH=44 /DNA_ID= /DNA_START= /DNA_END= /DNA_ORIENTATION=